MRKEESNLYSMKCIDSFSDRNLKINEGWRKVFTLNIFDVLFRPIFEKDIKKGLVKRIIDKSHLKSSNF